MADMFKTFAPGLTSPASDGFAITPQDGTDLPVITRAIYVGVSGDLALVLQGGGTVVLSNALAGMLLPLRVARVLASGTTAQDLVGLY